MFLGLTFEKVVLIAVVAGLLVGPERLPQLARGLAQAVQLAKVGFARTTDRVRQEMGPEFDDVDWRRLDPRQYDPRRIVRDALLEPASDFRPVPPPLPATEPEASDGPRATGPRQPVIATEPLGAPRSSAAAAGARAPGAPSA